MMDIALGYLAFAVLFSGDFMWIANEHDDY